MQFFLCQIPIFWHVQLLPILIWIIRTEVANNVHKWFRKTFLVHWVLSYLRKQFVVKTCSQSNCWPHYRLTWLLTSSPVYGTTYEKILWAPHTSGFSEPLSLGSPPRSVAMGDPTRGRCPGQHGSQDHWADQTPLPHEMAVCRWEYSLIGSTKLTTWVKLALVTWEAPPPLSSWSPVPC